MAIDGDLREQVREVLRSGERVRFLGSLLGELGIVARGEYVAAGRTAAQAAARLQSVNELGIVVASQLRSTLAGFPAYPDAAFVERLREHAETDGCADLVAAAVRYALERRRPRWDAATLRVPERFTAGEWAAAQAAVRELHHLQECVVERLLWHEPEQELTVHLTYIWTPDGRICYAAGLPPARVLLHFSGVGSLLLDNALTPAMLAEPERLDWGISEIARLDVTAPPDGEPLAEAVFAWERERTIRVRFAAVELAVE